jgi:hypothetical protein
MSGSFALKSHVLTKIAHPFMNWKIWLVSAFLYMILQEKVPLLSITALHHLHIFIFVLAVVHVTFCALTIIFGGAKVCWPYFLFLSV